jgi:serine/threonine protein kinase
MGISFGRYELLKRVAAGGMGEVFLARQAGFQGFEKLLVVKVLLPHLMADEGSRTMFLDEARLAARLLHPNVVQIYDLGQVGDMFYIAMEYVHGESLVEVWKIGRNPKKRMPLPLVARVIADAAAGLDYAHKAIDTDSSPLHLVHRDVSPHNILVSFEGSTKVIDFGIAKAAGRATHTKTGLIRGKSSYMSPEQLHEKTLDGRSDIFALGIVFYELATGTRLFQRDTEIAGIKAILECNIPPAPSLNNEIDPMLDSIMMQALAKEPEERFKDAAAMRLALEDWLVQKQRPGSGAHLAKYMREVFSDRLDAEKATGKPFLPHEGTPSSIFRADLLPRTESIAMSSDPGMKASAATVVSKTEPTPVLPRATAPQKKRPVVFVAAAVPVVVGLGIAGWLFASKPAAEPAQSPAVVEVPAASPRKSDPPSQAASETVTLTVTSKPQGATVLVDGVVAGKTPLPIQRTRGDTTLECEIKLDGFKAVTKRLVPDHDQSVAVTLEPRKKKQQQADSSPLDIKLDR